MEKLTKERVEKSIKIGKRFVTVFRLLSILNAIFAMLLVISGNGNRFSTIFSISVSAFSFVLAFIEQEDVELLERYRDSQF